LQDSSFPALWNAVRSILVGLDTETIERSEHLSTSGARIPVPGLVLVFSVGRPLAMPLPLVDGQVELGRDHAAFLERSDPRMSRHHALVRLEGTRFSATDLGSRNGTAVDGQPLPSGVPREASRVIRVGDSLFVPCRDVAPLQRLGVRMADGRVEGPALQEALELAAHAARLGTTLHVGGESGAGKEGMARAFHAAGGGAKGPFEAVNCATIPEGVAERLLFGTKRGAYSGADADADGYVQAAHGGTLFLDEIAELSLPVQAKLLRVLETGEVLPLGASRPRKVDLRLCSATHRDLRAQVAAGKLREDLYFRIATPRVVVPPLRERPEELGWLLHEAVRRTAPACSVHVSLVEACLLRPWPGNVRELLAEIRSAVQAAVASGATRVEGRHLGETAGSAFAVPADIAAGAGPAEPSKPTPKPSSAPPTRARLVKVLERCKGNISAAARELGAHRTQLRRWMERHGIDPRAYGAGEDPE
jgi:transcriptional regulator of acetoin/glycerol metabolism